MFMRLLKLEHLQDQSVRLWIFKKGLQTISVVFAERLFAIVITNFLLQNIAQHRGIIFEI